MIAEDAQASRPANRSSVDHEVALSLLEFPARGIGKRTVVTTSHRSSPPGLMQTLQIQGVIIGAKPRRTLSREVFETCW
jgi:hypothetical protein